MWTIQELKRKGKTFMFKNYWKTVLVALILSVVVGGAGAGIGGLLGSTGGWAGFVPGITIKNDIKNEIKDYQRPGSDSALNDDDWADLVITDEDGNTVELPSDFKDMLPDEQDLAMLAVAFSVFIVAFCLIAGIISLVSTLVNVFLVYPLEIGASRFMVTNFKERAKLRELAFGYDHRYMKNVGTLFLRNLYISLWSLLFIVPGIVKSYEYMMVPYIRAEYPEMGIRDTFRLSKEMMRGNKWHAFGMDLSFIGWNLLSSMTWGILGIFYVRPYQYMTKAALYDILRDKPETIEVIPEVKGAPAEEMPAAPAETEAEAPAEVKNEDTVVTVSNEAPAVTEVTVDTVEESAQETAEVKSEDTADVTADEADGTEKSDSVE